jgi:Ca-activated chloride channel homolog
MHSKNLTKLRPLRAIPLVAAILFCCPQSSHSAQTPPQPAAQVQSHIPAPTWNPTQPETQPPLNVDRDPVPSPEPPPAAAAATTAPAAPNSPGQLQKNQNGMYVYRTNVDEVLLNCTVVDEKGQIVTDLKPGDFRVWEDGISEHINSVEHEDLPVSMGILVDNSGSMRDKRAAVNQAAMNFLEDSNPRDEDFVVNFSDRAYLDQGFTSSLTALDRGLSHFDSHGTTALYDAVAASADELSQHGKDRSQVILIITDGADNASRLTLAQAVRRVQNLGGPVVYSIGLIYDTPRNEADEARSALETLSDDTGGIAYFARSLDDVNRIAAEVAHDIREQYVIDYHSSRPFTLGGFRTVHIEASAPHHGRLFVRTIKGYYVKSEKQPQVAQNASR